MRQGAGPDRRPAGRHDDAAHHCDAVRTAALAEAERKLLDHATAHPDRAGLHQPHAIAARRLLLWRCWVLAGESSGRAAGPWEQLTGEALTPQRVGVIVSGVADLAGRTRRRQHRSRD